MKKLLVILFVVIVVAGIVWFVTTTRKGEGEHLVVTGSAELAPVMKEIAARFETLNPGARIDVQGGGSGRGLDDVRGGLADIGMVSGRAGAGDHLHWFAVARDGVAFVVGSHNTVGALSKADVGGIYTGTITNWRALGGADRPITAVSWEEGRGVLKAFLRFTGLDGPAIKARVIAADDDRVIATVAGQAGAVGYLPLSAALAAVHDGSLALVRLDGIDARAESIRNGSYPAIITHSLVTRGPPQGLAKRLIDFTRSTRNADLITVKGMVAVSP